MMTYCASCRHAVKISEHEYLCNADQYDIDNKTCFAPKGLDDVETEAFININKISANADMLSGLLNNPEPVQK